MAEVAAPKRKTTTKGAPPPAELVTNNLNKSEAGDMKTLTFRISPEFHREFKAYAALNDLSMLELLYRAFENYRETHG